MPASAPDDKIFVFRLFASRAMSNLTIGDQDQVTLTVPVKIEAGAEPLYLVLSSSRAMIWRLEGDVGRVSRVVVLQSERGPVINFSGVTGVDRSRVTFAPERSCLAPDGDFKKRANRGEKVFQEIHGRIADVYKQENYASSISISSMIATSDRVTRGQAHADQRCGMGQGRPDDFGPPRCDWVQLEIDASWSDGVAEQTRLLSSPSFRWSDTLSCLRRLESEICCVRAS